MNNKTIDCVFIAGGYGMIGSNVAMQIRARFPEVKIILAGRNPERGEKLAQELRNTTTVEIDLGGKQIPEQAKEAQIIVSAVPDPQNLLGEYAIRNHIAFINITAGTGDSILPLLNLANIYRPSQPIVPLGYYEAGMLLPLVDLLARQFGQVDSIEMTALQDPTDPLGEMTSSELNNEIPPALLRKEGFWLHSSEPREITLAGGERVSGVPFSVLDVSAVAAMTNAGSVRLDAAFGLSAGMPQTGKPSLDLYVDMKGTDTAGKPMIKRILASDPQGQAHFTALGVLIVIEAMLASNKSGLLLPEQFVEFDIALRSMREAGIVISQD